MKKYIFILALSCLFNHSAFSQLKNVTKITWEVLKDVSFSERYSNEYKVEFDYPSFGTSVKALEAKLIQLKGYAIPLDPSTYILSSEPMASCFFCGGAGPESVIQLKFESPLDLNMDEIITVRGVFKLNYNNLQELNYILESASLL